MMPITDVVDGIVVRHPLLLQRIGSWALALGKDRHEHVGARRVLAARRLHMYHGGLPEGTKRGSANRVDRPAPVGSWLRVYFQIVHAEALAMSSRL
jgi:hypothetical protein